MQVSDKQNLNIKSNRLYDELSIAYSTAESTKEGDLFALLVTKEMNSGTVGGEKRTPTGMQTSKKEDSKGSSQERKSSSKGDTAVRSEREQTGNKATLSNVKKRTSATVRDKRPVRDKDRISSESNTTQESRDTQQSDTRYVAVANEENRKISAAEISENEKDGIKDVKESKPSDKSSARNELSAAQIQQNNPLALVPNSAQEETAPENETPVYETNNTAQNVERIEQKDKDASANAAQVQQSSIDKLSLKQPEDVNEAVSKTPASGELSKEVKDTNTTNADVLPETASVNVASTDPASSPVSRENSDNNAEQFADKSNGNVAVNTASLPVGAAEKTGQAAREFNGNAFLNTTSVPAGMTEKTVFWNKTESMLSGLSNKTRDAVVGKIQEMIENTNKTRVSQSMVIRLDPPQLGEVTLKITQKEDKIFARIIPESKEIEALLRGKSEEIRNILANSGIKTENINLSFGFDNFEREANSFEKMFAGYNLNDNPHDRHFAKQQQDSVAKITAEMGTAKAYGIHADGWIA